MSGDQMIDFSSFFNVMGDNEDYTHVQYTPDLLITLRDRKAFYKAYAERIYELQQEEESPYYPAVGMKYTGVVPIILRPRLIFKGKYEVINCDDFYAALVKVAQQCIRRMYKIKEDDDIVPELIACLLEGNDMFLQGKTYVSAFIYFPFCTSNHTDILERYYPLLINKLKEENILKYITVEGLEGNIDTILSREEAAKPAPLYMSRIDKTYSCAEVTHIFPELTLDNVEEYDDANDISLNKLIDPTSHYLTKDDENDEDHEDTYYLPYLFDLHFLNEDENHTGITPIVEDFETIPKTPMPPKKNIFNDDGRSYRGKMTTICKQMIHILKSNVQILRNYEQIIGMAIYGSDKLENGSLSREGEDIYFGVKRYLAEQADEPFNLRRSRIEYRAFRNKGVVYTYKSICYIVKLYEKDEFDKWHSQWLDRAFNESIRNPDLPILIAEVIYREFFMIFIQSEHRKDVWYYFNEYIWEKSDKTVQIQRKIQEVIVPMYKKRLTEYNTLKAESDDPEVKRRYNINIKSVEGIIKRLSTIRGINEIIRLLSEMVYDKDFNNNQNSNEHIMGIQNGVLEAKPSEVIFRPGIPEDYITKTATVFYEEGEHYWSHPNVEFLMNWFRQMWCVAVGDYVLKFFSSAFIGKNIDKIFLLFTGGGNNGKSKLSYLLSITFGDDYYVDIAPEAFTKRKSSASGATEEWEDARNSRIIGVNEPSEDFYSDILKKITGGDGFRSRGLHEKGGKMKATMKPCIFANEPPGFQSDKAMKERVRLIDCKAMYVPAGKAPKTIEEQLKRRRFPIDKNIENKLDKCKEAFLWILMQYYKKYREEGMEIPNEILVTENKYWKKYDFYKSFISEIIDFKDSKGDPLDQNTTMQITDVYKLFSSWYAENHPNKKIPDINSFKYRFPQQGIELDEDETICIGIRSKKMDTNMGNMAGLMPI